MQRIKTNNEAGKRLILEILKYGSHIIYAAYMDIVYKH